MGTKDQDTLAHEGPGKDAESETPLSAPGIAPTLALPGGSTASPDDAPLPSMGDIFSFSKPQAPMVGKRFRDYEIQKEIARGGMGVVYKARQVSLNRMVAVKMILAGQFAGDQEVQRFHTEAEAAANLHHPHIVAIYEVGEHEGRHFFSMEYVEGESLAEVGRGTPLTAMRAARYVQKIAEAIHYAHQHGTLHRDLKPSNVIVDRSDEPRVMDFGLAKLMTGDSQLTTSGTILGTPSYMPPEQAAGNRGEIGPRSDVYSLGAILYELLVGRPPFRSESPMETLMQVLELEPVPPCLLNPKIPQDLETICLKCLQKETTRRYATAAELVEDLRRYLQGEPIMARPVSAVERAWRWCRRKPALAGLSAALILAVVGGFAAVTHQWRRAESSLELARTNLELARTNSRNLRLAVDKFLTEVGERELYNVAGMDPQREKLLNEARRLYEELLKQAPDDVSVQNETALAYHRLGDIHRLLGQRDEAKAAYEEATKRLAALVDEFPTNAAYRENLGTSYNWLGELLRTTSKLNDAEPQFRKALGLQQQLVRLQPEAPQHQQALARTHYNLALLMKDSNRPEDSERAYREALSLQQTLVSQHAEVPLYRQELAKSHFNLGSLLKNTGRPAEADAAQEQAISLLAELVAKNPTSRDYRYELGVCYINRGNLLQNDASRRGDAEQAYRKAIKMYETLVAEFSNTPVYRKELAQSYNGLGSVLFVTGNAAEAEPAWRRAQELYAKLAEESPGVPEYQHLLGGALGNVGVLLSKRNEPAAARPLLEQAIRCQRTALDSNRDHPTYRQFLRNAYGALSQVLLKLADHAALSKAAVELSQVYPSGFQEHLRSAGLLAQCMVLAENDPALSADERLALSRAYAARALGVLDEAVSRGFHDAEALRKSQNLDPVRDHDGFKKLMVRVEAGGKK